MSNKPLIFDQEQIQSALDTHLTPDELREAIIKLACDYGSSIDDVIIVGNGGKVALFAEESQSDFAALLRALEQRNAFAVQDNSTINKDLTREWKQAKLRKGSNHNKHKGKKK